MTEPTPTPEPTSEPTPTRPPRRRALVLAAVAAGLAIAAVGTVLIVNATRPTDEELIRAAAAAYLQALEQGDAETALAHTAPLAEDPQCPALLTSAVYGDVAGRPSQAEIVAVDIYEGGIVRPNQDPDAPRLPAAYVGVVYEQGEGGRVRSAELTLEKSEEGWVVAHDSALGLGTPNLTPVSEGEVTLNGECGTDTDLALLARVLPGTYEVAYHDPTNVLIVDPFEVTVPNGSPITIQPKASPDVLAQVEAQVKDWITMCISAGYVGDTCGVVPVAPSTYLDPATAVAEPSEVRIGLEPALRIGRGYTASVDQEFTGTTTCEGLTRNCVAGVPGRAVVFFTFRGELVVDDDGVIILTTDIP